MLLCLRNMGGMRECVAVSRARVYPGLDHLLDKVVQHKSIHPLQLFAPFRLDWLTGRGKSCDGA
jgi:hypothetical protein